MKTPLLFPYLGKMMTVSEILAIYGKDDLTHETLLYRLKSRKTVEECLDGWKPQQKAYRKAEKHLCSDGVKRTHAEIAGHLGMNKDTWMGKFYRVGLERAWVEPVKCKFGRRL